MPGRMRETLRMRLVSDDSPLYAALAQGRPLQGFLSKPALRLPESAVKKLARESSVSGGSHVSSGACGAPHTANRVISAAAERYQPTACMPWWVPSQVAT